MRFASAVVTSLLLSVSLTTLACQPGPDRVTKAKRGPAKERSEDIPDEPPQAQGEQLLVAGGLRLRLPANWIVLPSEDPNFGMALAPAPTGTQVFGCVIELRRQGAGPLSAASKSSSKSSPGDLRYTQGPLHGRLREFPGSSPDSALLAHCRGPRASTDWAALDLGLDALEPSAPPQLPARESEAEAEAETEAGQLVELCTGTRARKTHLCVRRRDGAVFCGMSEHSKLEQVRGLPPATSISCDGVRACSHDAEGQLSCWRLDGEAVAVPSLGKVRDLAGGCVVTEAGKVSCREHDELGLTLGSFAELIPHGDSAQALSKVSEVLAGSTSEAGCVVAAGELRCWDVEGGPQVIETVGEVRDLVRIGKRLCTLGDSGWTCFEGERRFEFESCAERSCGCSLLGARSISCEHEPHTRLDSHAFGHISDVTLADGACAVRSEGTVVCRGAAAGSRDDSPKIRAMVTGQVPGILHELQLVE